MIRELLGLEKPEMVACENCTIEVRGDRDCRVCTHDPIRGCVEEGQ